ncbi:MAG: tetratricopeptide repeat protein [Terriglobales bacterium]
MAAMRNLALVLALCAALVANAQAPADTLPITTLSEKARELYTRALSDSMNFHLERALTDWRAAVKLDPNFALANLFIAFRTQDPVEAKAALKKANAAAPHSTAGERLMVKWITGVREGNFVSGIAAMNDLVAMYPKDKQLLSLAGNWLMVRGSYDRAADLLNRALEVDPGYPPALNSAAYAYAQMGDFAQATTLMERYAKALPNEPNAQDSYAEILRMAGKFDEAVERYQAALKIEPGFSIMGLADTYALKGDEQRARAEYARCNEQAEMSEDRILCRLQMPITYVREKNYKAADEAYLAAAKWAHAKGLGLMEAQAHRLMAEYQPKDDAALMHLQQAETTLKEHPNVSKSDADEERARILRWRYVRMTHAGKQAPASQVLAQLRTLASGNASEIVQREYAIAAGAMALAGHDAKHAIPYLREGRNDAFAMEMLVRAYEQTGDKESLAAARTALGNLNLPTMDQALVVPAFRGK